MKLLIIGDKSRFIHLESFCNSLEKYHFESRLIYDMDFLSGFFDSPTSKSKNKKKFEEMISEYNPDFVLLDRVSKLGLDISKQNIPFGILLRGNIWEEIQGYKKKSKVFLRENFSIRKYKKMVDECFDLADIIFPISKYLEKEVRERYPGERIELLYADGRNPSEWNEGQGMKLKHPCVGLLQGAGVWNKTKEILTLDKILNELPNVNFYWAGDGDYKKDILEVLEKHKNFKWIGKIKYPEQVKQFLTEIDVFALSSGLEGFGQSILEAQLMKKPTICSNVGGIPEIIKNGYNGFLVGINDHVEWKKRILEVLEDTKKSKEMSQNGYDIVSKNFNWEIIAEKFYDIIIKNSNLLEKQQKNQ